jgi:hypothetical protein
MSNHLSAITGFESIEEIEAATGLGSNELVLLSREALLRFVERRLRGELSSIDLERIAEMLDANERLDLEEDYRESLAQALFRLSSPEINHPLNDETVDEIGRSLRKVPAA